MKIAFVALPRIEQHHVAPPLPLTYIAALLEQQRHIVRIYDLALCGTAPLAEALAPLRAFRPHVVVIAADDPASAIAAEAALAGCDAALLRLGLGLREPAPGLAVAQALWRMDGHRNQTDEQRVIFGALLALDDDLDALPLPARHLLPLEQYPLATPAGERQTPVLIGQQLAADTIIPRNPTLIIAEMGSIIHEHGIWHFILSGPPLTHDLAWLRALLYHIGSSDLGIGWEGCMQYSALTPELLQMCRWAGCEVICCAFDALAILGDPDERATLMSIIDQAHQLGISVRADIQLDPSNHALPALIDIAATFGLDNVRFTLQPAPVPQTRAIGDRLNLEDVVEMAQSRYRSSRSRQFFIERFGPQLGPMLWRVGRAGLLGRTWQRYADGAEDASGLVAGSVGN